jgi:tellurite resistance protein TerC
MFAPTVVGWTTTLAVIGGLVAFDLWHSVRHRRAIGWRAAAGWSLFYVAIAALFGVVFALWAGWDLGTQYLPATSSREACRSTTCSCSASA